MTELKSDQRQAGWLKRESAIGLEIRKVQAKQHEPDEHCREFARMCGQLPGTPRTFKRCVRWPVATLPYGELKPLGHPHGWFNSVAMTKGRHA